MFEIPELSKPVQYVLVGLIVVGVLIWTGSFSTTAKTVVDSGEAVIEAGKTICEAKDIVMEELLDIAYDEAPEEAKKILDRFGSGEELTGCDYYKLYNTLNKKHIKNWIMDESCNALVCSGI